MIRAQHETDCHFFLSGSCRSGNQCGFRHSEYAKNNTMLCQFWLQGKCNKGPDCFFRHPSNPQPAWEYGQYMPAPTDGGAPLPCIFFLRGNCMKGDSCAFSHSTPQVPSALSQAAAALTAPTIAPTLTPVLQRLASAGGTPFGAVATSAQPNPFGFGGFGNAVSKAPALPQQEKVGLFGARVNGAGIPANLLAQSMLQAAQSTAPGADASRKRARDPEAELALRGQPAGAGTNAARDKRLKNSALARQHISATAAESAKGKGARPTAVGEPEVGTPRRVQLAKAGPAAEPAAKMEAFSREAVSEARRKAVEAQRRAQAAAKPEGAQASKQGTDDKAMSPMKKQKTAASTGGAVDGRSGMSASEPPAVAPPARSKFSKEAIAERKRKFEESRQRELREAAPIVAPSAVAVTAATTAASTERKATAPPARMFGKAAAERAKAAAAERIKGGKEGGSSDTPVKGVAPKVAQTGINFAAPKSFAEILEEKKKKKAVAQGAAATATAVTATAPRKPLQSAAAKAPRAAAPKIDQLSTAPSPVPAAAAAEKPEVPPEVAKDLIVEDFDVEFDVNAEYEDQDVDDVNVDGVQDLDDADVQAALEVEW
ncbi:hypothetical protein CYMTET_3511 [Cymbomonas tetramitiformis]|uniref:C3H1-type domain-containing protein n=1 Tax=Cymbomonas tetramitiformis TaxID=36881 RepID=A0AAE0LKS0_9CHLO|nr:hypothetical protein CYMTET_3511 [Cymbomonas tetramitiformis]